VVYGKMLSVPTAEPSPRLIMTPARGTTRAVVLVLHGGKVVSRDLPVPRDVSALRMLPFTWAVRRRTRTQGVAVWRLRYRYRGWNGTDASPVADAQWALQEVRRLHGDVPVVLLGHSMGGRAATQVAGDPLVAGLVLLAAWLPDSDALCVRPGTSVAVLYGDRDRITGAACSVGWAERARSAGVGVLVTVIPGGEHFMLRRFWRWHRLAADAVVGALHTSPSAPVSPGQQGGDAAVASRGWR
jgi:acetyl esterase/lipase